MAANWNIGDMGRASYQHVDDIRIGVKPCGRVGRIEASLQRLLAPHVTSHKRMEYAKAIADACPRCVSVVELLAETGRKMFTYRDAEGNLRAGELK
jgi:hypothetical protein